MKKPHEFESQEKLQGTAKKEAIVCGDEVRKKDDGNTIEIFNWHAGEVRWKGVVVKEKKGPWYESVSPEEGGPFSGVGPGNEPQESKRPYSDEFYKETGFMRDDE